MKNWAKFNYALLSDARIIRLMDDMGTSGLAIYTMLRLEIDCMGEGKLSYLQALNISPKRVRKNRVEKLIKEYDLFELDEQGFVHTCLCEPAQTPGHTPAQTPGHTPADGPGHRPAQVIGLSFKEQNREDNINPINPFVEQLADESGFWRETVCMQSTYGDLLKRHWKEAVRQFGLHVTAYGTSDDICNLSKAKYYFNSYIKTGVKTGQALYDHLMSLELKSKPVAVFQSSSPAPADAPERPSPDHVWSFATDSWVKVH